MRCLVVGAGGFIGANASRLLKARRHEVTEIVGSARGPAPDRVFVYEAGIYRRLAATIHGTDLVVYAAGRCLPRDDLGRDAAIELDCRPFDALLEVIAPSSYPTTVLLMSSAGVVYGEAPASARLTEDMPTQPISPYGVTRVLMEESLRSHAGRSGIRGIVFRVSNLYGPGQAADRGSAFILNALQSAALGRPVTLLGTGRQQRDFLYIDDLADAVRCVSGLVAERQYSGESTFNICAARSHSLLEVLDLVQQVTDRKLSVRWVEGHPGDVGHVKLSGAKAAAELGWESQTSLREGIARTWAWVNGRSSNESA